MERILTLNIGATRLALAEFEVRPGRGPALLRYTFGELPEGAAESPDTFSVELEQALRGMMTASGIHPGRIHVALSGQMAFPRFVKVLAEGDDKMREQIQFEVEQNVPFPLSEAIWDDALVGQPDAGEQHVMIVAARSDLVKAVAKGLLNAGCEPELVDVAPVALYNAVRFNYPEDEGCTLVVDIGARCTNLVFVEQERIFYRTIPVAGHTITAEIAKQFGLSMEDAETFKCTQGLVAQGGAFAVDDPDVDRLSKVIRNVMTRLNAEVSRSIAFYRSQQEGSAPVRVLLSGASSQLPYMQNFFEEKLQVEVDFLNPFQTVGYPTDVDAEQFGSDAFSLPVLVGLALRRGLTCPVEISLVSPEIVARKAFRKRIPFFAISAAGVIVFMGIWLAYVGMLGGIYEKQSKEVSNQLSDYNNLKSKYADADEKATEVKELADAYGTLLASRDTWRDIVRAVDDSVAGISAKGNISKDNTAKGKLWVTKLVPKREGNALQGITLSVSVWSDSEDDFAASGKTIDETVIANLAKAEVGETKVFETDNIVLDRKGGSGKVDQTQGQVKKSEWMTSFDITANLSGVKKAQPKTSSNRRTRRR